MPVSQTAPHQAIYRRWRAQTFAQIVGQEAVVQTLRNAVRGGRVAHAVLFVGPRGTGKTSLARILAKALNCTNLQDGDPCDACEACVAIREGTTLDVIEIDAASNRGIGDVKDLRDALNYAPSSLRRKVYILDEAHQITKDAWNALLKSLEEPPEFVNFMFASTHPQEFPPAILSRLQRYDVRRLTVPEIEGKLERILAAESIEADPAAIHLIARLAAGGMRDAETMLDQVLASGDGPIDEARVRDLLGLADTEAVNRLLDSLLTGDAASGVMVLDQLDERGRDARVVLDQLVDSIREAIGAALRDPTGQERLVALTAAARRLAAIDPDRSGVGGVRLQLELAILRGAADTVTTRPLEGIAIEAPAVAPAPATVVSRPAATVVTERLAGAESATVPDASTEPPVEPPAEAPGPAPVPAVALETAVEASPETPPTASSDPGPPVTADLERLVRSWDEIVASVRPATRAVITECRPLTVEGNVVTLGFPEAKAFLKDVADRKRPDLEAAIGGFLGRDVAVRCVATNLDLAPPATAGDDAAYLLQEARRIFADDLVDVGEVT
jgi:DNA polymerase-3 subunit gamma/tau